VFLWPVKLPDEDARFNSWNDSAREAVSKAMEAWVRVVANMQVGGYEYQIAIADLPEPTWPDCSFNEILSIAFKGDRLIDSVDHHLVQRLRGCK
jgi:hypothetical protein